EASSPATPSHAEVTQKRDESAAERRAVARAEAAEEAKRRRAEALAAIARLRSDLETATQRVGEAKEAVKNAATALREAEGAEKASRHALAMAIDRAKEPPARY